MNKKEKKDGIYFIVNGQPIEMCPKTLNLCNKRAQNLLSFLKKQSMKKAHTMRFFWGDVVMLNILTNQLLQSVNSRSLARVLKPVDTLQEDLEEYRIQHKEKIDKMKDALIIANDDTLPLDYSRELEKYYKKIDLEDVDDTESTEEDFVESIPIKFNSNINKENSNDNTQEIQTNDKPPTIQPSNIDIEDKDTNPIQSKKTPQNIEPTNNTLQLETKEQNIPQNFQNNKTEFEKHQESFATFDTIDVSSLFN